MLIMVFGLATEQSLWWIALLTIFLEVRTALWAMSRYEFCFKLFTYLSKKKNWSTLGSIIKVLKDLDQGVNQKPEHVSMPVFFLLAVFFIVIFVYIFCYVIVI